METKKVQGEETRAEQKVNSTQESKKKGTMAKHEPASGKDKKRPENDLTKDDIPDSTNESTGVPGSGQRQDSN